MPDCQDRFCILRGEACDDRFKYLEQNLTLQLSANEKAVLTAKGEMERRLEGMNEFRAQLNSQAGTFLERKAYESEHRLLQKEVDMLREWKAKSDGATSWSNVIAVAALIISFIFATLHFITKL